MKGDDNIGARGGFGTIYGVDVQGGITDIIGGEEIAESVLPEEFDWGAKTIPLDPFRQHLPQDMIGARGGFSTPYGVDVQGGITDIIGGRTTTGFDLGDTLSDVVKPVQQAAQDVEHTAGNVLDQALSPVRDVLNQNPWLRDAIYDGGDAFKSFAASSTGQTLLRAFTTMLYYSLAASPMMLAYEGVGGITMLVAQIGATLAPAVFALPGMAKGDAFDQAWLQESVWRTTKTIEMISQDPELSAQFGASLPDQVKNLGAMVQSQYQNGSNALQSMASQQFPGLPMDQALAQVNITPEDLAAKIGIRPDIAAALLNFFKKQNLYNLDLYDLKTGTHKLLAATVASVMQRSANIVPGTKPAPKPPAYLSRLHSAAVTQAAPSLTYVHPAVPVPVPVIPAVSLAKPAQADYASVKVPTQKLAALGLGVLVQRHLHKDMGKGQG